MGARTTPTQTSNEVLHFTMPTLSGGASTTFVTWPILRIRRQRWADKDDVRMQPMDRYPWEQKERGEAPRTAMGCRPTDGQSSPTQGCEPWLGRCLTLAADVGCARAASWKITESEQSQLHDRAS